MKRVLHVMRSLEHSGMEGMLLNSFAEWERIGYQCDVLATGAAIGPVAQQMRESGYGVTHSPFRSRFRYLPRTAFLLEFFRLCRSGYDVVHIHTETGRPVFALLAKLAGVRRIALTLHGLFRFKGPLRIRKKFERHVVRLLGGRFGVISGAVEKCEWETFGIKGIRISNWLDTSRFRPPTEEQRRDSRALFKVPSQAFVIVSVGNCSAIKNHEAILRAVPMLPSPIDALYLHVGREQPEHPERSLAMELGIENHVHYLGPLADPLPALWAADAFLMPSSFEGLGVAAMEAIASGVPCILSNVAGLSEVAAETKWTMLVQPTPQSIAEGLRTLSEMPAKDRREKALEDSQTVRERFSIESGVRSIATGLYA